MTSVDTSRRRLSRVVVFVFWVFVFLSCGCESDLHTTPRSAQDISDTELSEPLQMTWETRGGPWFYDGTRIRGDKVINVFWEREKNRYIRRDFTISNDVFLQLKQILESKNFQKLESSYYNQEVADGAEILVNVRYKNHQRVIRCYVYFPRPIVDLDSMIDGIKNSQKGDSGNPHVISLEQGRAFEKGE